VQKKFEPTAATAAAADGLPVPQRYWAMVAILLGIALSVLDSTVVNLALPDITRNFGATPASAVWVVNAYQLATLVLLLPCAQLGERVGYRRVYMVGLTVFTVASLACVVAPTLMLLAGARALQGLGAAGMMAVNAALVRLTYPSNVLGRGIALNSVVVAAASVAGPTVAAVVLSVASWPWLFLIQLPLGVAVFVIGRRALPFNAVRTSGPRLHPLDVVLNIAMFSLVFLAADALGARKGIGPDAQTRGIAIALLLAGAALGWFYMRRQFRLPVPLFPAQTLAFIALPFVLLEGQGRSHFGAGLVLTAWPAAIVLIAPLAGRLIHRYPGGLLGGIGQGVLAAGLAWLALLPQQPPTWEIVTACAVCGLGFGLFQSPNNHTIVTSAPLRRAGAASGMLGSARLTGQSLGAVLLGLIFGAAGVKQGGSIALGLASTLAAASAIFSSLRLRG
jgi:DHA2 family multidrug resistance protein-like MFS transporter